MGLSGKEKMFFAHDCILGWPLAKKAMRCNNFQSLAKRTVQCIDNSFEFDYCDEPAFCKEGSCLWHLLHHELDDDDTIILWLNNSPITTFLCRPL